MAVFRGCLSWFSLLWMFPIFTRVNSFQKIFDGISPCLRLRGHLNYRYFCYISKNLLYYLGCFVFYFCFSISLVLLYVHILPQIVTRVNSFRKKNIKFFSYNRSGGTKSQENVRCKPAFVPGIPKCPSLKGD